MPRFKYPAAVDTSRYTADAVSPEAYYGLPNDVRFCSRCVISNQRPNSAVEFRHTSGSKKSTIRFDADEICDACRVAEEKTPRSIGPSATPVAGVVRPISQPQWAVTIASFQGPAARTASMPRTC